MSDKLQFPGLVGAKISPDRSPLEPVAGSPQQIEDAVMGLLLGMAGGAGLPPSVRGGNPPPRPPARVRVGPSTPPDPNFTSPLVEARRSRGLGFREDRPGQPYSESRFSYDLPVRVTFKGNDVVEDAVKGLNKGHALARAWQNWPDATKIEPVLPTDSFLRGAGLK
jgi:hypothetical protein